MPSLTKNKQYELVKANMRAAIRADNVNFGDARNVMFDAIKTGVIDQKNAAKLISKINKNRPEGAYPDNFVEFHYAAPAKGSAVAVFLQMLKPVALHKDMSVLALDKTNYYGGRDYLKVAIAIVNLRAIEQVIRTKAGKLPSVSQQATLNTAANIIRDAYAALTVVSRSASDSRDSIKIATDLSFAEINNPDTAALINMPRGIFHTDLTTTRRAINTATDSLRLLQFQRHGVEVSMPSIGKDYDSSKALTVSTSSHLNDIFEPRSGAGAGGALRKRKPAMSQRPKDSTAWLKIKRKRAEPARQVDPALVGQGHTFYPGDNL